MVAMALTLFIMVILTQAFVLALETFAGMKGVGDMQMNLRAATILLRDDLGQDHFEGKRRLSDLTVTGTSQIAALPPQAGHFAIRHGSAFTTMPPALAPGAYHQEGQDTNGLFSYRATDHALYMTVKRKGNRQENFFTAPLSGNANVLTPFFNAQTAYDVAAANLPESTMTLPYPGGPIGHYGSQWAEVAYYLKRVGSTEEPNNPNSAIGTPTFELYRAQFVMVPDGTPLRTPTTPANTNIFVNQPAGSLATMTLWSQTTFAPMSCLAFSAPSPVGAPSSHLWFYSPMEAAQRARIIPDFSPTASALVNFDPQAAAPNATTNRVLLNEAPVLSNVLSFHVQIMPTGANTLAFVDVPNTGTSGRLYDTTLMNAAPNVYNNKFGLKAIQVTLRVFDNKTRQTRQVTIVQDL